MRGEINSPLVPWNEFCHSAENLLSSLFMPKSVKIKIYMFFNIFLPSTSMSSKLSLSFGFPHQNPVGYALLYPPYVIHAQPISASLI
jgi:hypothetical protein